ncbi:Microcystin-dependent protein [Paenibacillus algorifonticola]|uniref:Microcystin-dependent protein n=1 Tax=Paenibacillus algorifonticola TaxID=684063 RepID=A0A1I2F4T6_9BACL|nr:tail fiber protein [Paenibacillus algorifonticola]SFF00444.1 Microcystin-dependent protein [Paenibacillus algorifonticola]
MSEAYIGEIRMFAGNYAPEGWARCEGQIMSISENETLYVLLGTTYGGDGQTTFALPDLRGRLPIHQTASYPLGAKGGSENVTLTTTQLPAHTHFPTAAQIAGNASSPQNNTWAKAAVYSTGNDSSNNPLPRAPMNYGNLSLFGGSQPHNNMMPSLTISFIIALSGAFPPRD